MESIIVLEDEALLMKLLCHMLKGFTLLQARTAEEALQLFDEQNHQIDLIVADVTLPTRSGIAVALQLRSQNPDLPVILTSGYPVSAWSKEDAGDLEDLGTYSVTILQKPFQARILLAAIRDLLGSAQNTKVRTA